MRAICGWIEFSLMCLILAIIRRIFAASAYCRARAAQADGRVEEQDADDETIP